MGLKLNFIGVPAAVRRDLKALVKLYRPTFPAWLHTLNIQYALRPPEEWDTGDGRRALAAIAVSHEYRHATVAVFEEGWNFPTTDKERVFVHEMAHIPIAPLEKFAHNLLDSLLAAEQDAAAPPNPLLEALYEEARKAMETVVEDVATAMIAARRAP